MEIARSIDEIRNMDKTAVALGNFDGVHLGHQELIRETVEQAEKDGIKSAVFTFSNHPSNIMPGVKAVKSYAQSMQASGSAYSGLMDQKKYRE